MNHLVIDRDADVPGKTSVTEKSTLQPASAINFAPAWSTSLVVIPPDKAWQKLFQG